MEEIERELWNSKWNQTLAKGDAQEIEALLEKYPLTHPWFSFSPFYLDPLMWTCHFGTEKVLRIFLRAPSAKEAFEQKGTHGLIYNCIQGRNFQHLSLVFEICGPQKFSPDWPLCPLSLAICKARVDSDEFLRLLFDNIIFPEESDNPASLLHLALSRSNIKASLFLIEKFSEKCFLSNQRRKQCLQAIRCDVFKPDEVRRMVLSLALACSTLSPLDIDECNCVLCKEDTEIATRFNQDPIQFRCQVLAPILGDTWATDVFALCIFFSDDFLQLKEV